MGSVGIAMKDMTLLTWLTQLGLSVALPPVVFILLAVWLRNSYGWGQWVIWVGIVLGFYSAVQGFRSSLKAMSRLSKSKQEKEPPPVGFNDHE